jgi:hypothetical protein
LPCTSHAFLAGNGEGLEIGFRRDCSRMRHGKTGKMAKKEGIFDIPHEKTGFASKSMFCINL